MITMFEKLVKTLHREVKRAESKKVSHDTKLNLIQIMEAISTTIFCSGVFDKHKIESPVAVLT